MMVFPRARPGKLARVGLALALACAACTKKAEEPVLNKEEMLGMAPHEGPDKVEIVLAKDINDAIPCSNYGDGCLSVHRVRARQLDFIVVEFSDGESARRASRKVRGWYLHNWLFDDVEGEPHLESWVEQHYKAQRFKPRGKAADSAGKPPGNG